MSFLFGRKERTQRVSGLDPQQQALQNTLVQAAQGAGAPGGFGMSADFYRSLLDPSSQAVQQFQAPAMRQFNEQIVPQLAEQFAGLGAGGSSLGGSAFRNALGMQGASLAERLNAMRTGLGMQGAQGLMGVGQQALNPYMQTYIRQRQPGFLENLSPLVGAGIGAFAGPALGVAGERAGQKLGNWMFG